MIFKTKVSMLTISTVFCFFFLLAGCGKENFVYKAAKNPAKVAFDFKIREIRGGGAVDVLWVIDNSNSMGQYQQAVIANAGLFMSDFITQRLSWKMGLVSTDYNDSPYLGFSAPFDNTTANPVGTFGAAIGRMGIQGNGVEQSFTPILNAFKKFPTFLRPNVPLAVIMVTDADEQSSMSTASFINSFEALTAGRRTFLYGVFAAKDYNCQTADPNVLTYAGSRYEAFINSGTLGHVYQLCTPNFGQMLAQIGKEITQQISRSIIYLDMRPKTDTLNVIYQGVKLPGGSKASGGTWYYDYDINAVVFYDLSFSVNETDGVKVEFSEDVGN